MSVAENEVQVLWSASASKSVTASSTDLSDAMDFSATAFAASITMKALHSTTPGADDYMDFYLMRSSGDPDGASTDEYPGDTGTDPTIEGEFLARLDMNENDPAIKTVDLPLPAHKFKIFVNNNAAEAVTVSCAVMEKTA